MDSVHLLANAKLNLTLDITGVRADGYHTIDSVIQSVNLFDEVVITKAEGFSLSSSARYLPCDERNVAYKAARALCAFVGRDSIDADIYIKKNIPTQAGMGGGSADAAAVLIGLCRLHSLNLDYGRLKEIALSVGSDVPFCLTGGCARVRGIGELVEPVPSKFGAPMLVVMPRHGSSTREAYARFDERELMRYPDTDGMINAVAAGSPRAVASRLLNVFEELTDEEGIERIRRDMLSRGALGASLTGSGAAVFGVFESYRAAKVCREQIKSSYARCFVVAPAERGVVIL